MRTFVFTLAITSLACLFSSGNGWSYTDLSNWNKTCEGTSQSPINVDRRSTVYDKDLRNTPLVLSGFDVPTDAPLSVFNNGHTVVFSLDGDEVKTITGGAMGQSVYNLKQLHFHWGADDLVGSEHTIDKVSYPLEMHMVFMRSNLSTFVEALAIPESLAVLGTMYEIGQVENEDYTDLIGQLNGVKYTGVSKNLTGIKLGSLLPNHMPSLSTMYDFYTYAGSLTTPPCSEVVIWNLLPTSVKITKTQMQEFRALTMTSEANKVNDIDQPIIGFNNRPIQALNGRVVKRSFEPYGFGAVRVVNNADNQNNNQNNNINSASSLSITGFLLVISSLLYSLITA